MRLHDTLWGLLVLLFGSAVALYARTFPATAGQSIGPGVFPFLIGVGFAVSGVVLIGAGLRKSRSRWMELDAWMGEPRTVVNAVLVVGVLIFYALAVETIGYFITAFIFLAVLFLALGVSRRWIAPIAAGVTLGLHVAFYSLLRVPLPWGWLERMAW
jgi:putative tricarboxylic transport membrane protein